MLGLAAGSFAAYLVTTISSGSEPESLLLKIRKYKLQHFVLALIVIPHMRVALTDRDS